MEREINIESNKLKKIKCKLKNIYFEKMRKRIYKSKE